MSFKKYSSIENSYRTKSINDIIQSGNFEGKWVVTEKVHGANFGFRITRDMEIFEQKRSSDICPDSNFYNHIEVRENHRAAILAIAANIFSESEDDVVSVTLFGEIFGGSYPHDDIERINNQTRVQGGVFYCPFNDFYLFDIITQSEVDFNYLSYAEMVRVSKSCATFPIAQPLFVGSFEDACNFENSFVSVVPNYYGLPAIEKNICEGVVIKPFDEVKFFGNGTRCILKNKNDHFAEVSNCKTGKKPKDLVVVTPEMQLEIDLVCSYINENRLRNVISKFGPVDNKDFGKLLNDFFVDVKDDFSKDHSIQTYGKTFSQYAKKTCAIIIRDNFHNIVDCTF